MYRKDTKFIPLSAESFREVVIQFNKDKGEFLEKYPELKEKFSKPKQKKIIIDFEEKEPEFRESERNAKKEDLSLREKVNSLGIDLTSKLGFILLIIFIVIQIILLNEMCNY